ncbi:MAG: hypothetical protein WCN98_04620, partial [Verrucomicrobiaceae bacterium]
ILKPLSFEEWRDVGRLLGQAVSKMKFFVGDWLVYGDTHFKKGPVAKRIASKAYDEAINATGLDRATLHNYAHVARRVAKAQRSEILTWEHHKVVAKLEADEQTRWLALARPSKKDRPVSTLRLRKSILVGRLLTPEEAHPDPLDRGIENHIPYVNRLMALWARMKESGWLKRATREQCIALQEDLYPVVTIHFELEHALENSKRGK